MTIIEAQVKDQELKVTTEPLVASGGINETTIHFSFCENWTNFVKTAVFADAGKENWYNVVLDANKAVVPAQVTATKGRFWFGVVGVKDQTRYTTKIIQYDVVEGVTLAEEDVEPPQTLIDQLMAALGNVSAEASAVRVEMQIHPTGAPVKDDTVAYIKDVPASSLSAAKINKIGGMTYKDGDTLKSAPVTEVESVGVNLIPYPYINKSTTINGVTYTDNGDGTITANGTATGQAYFTIYKGTFPIGTYSMSGCTKYLSGVSIYFSNGNYSFYKTDTGYGITFTTTTVEEISIVLNVAKGTTVDNFVFKPMLNKGSTALPYRPYTKNTLAIPEAVRPENGINENVYDYIDFEKKQFVKRVEKVVFNGTERWNTVSSNPNMFYISVSNALAKTNGGSLLANGYEFTMSSLTDDKTCTVSDMLYFLDKSYSTIADWKAFLTSNPLTVYYVLKEPIITDISDILPADNFIAVEGGGTMTFKNEHEFAVPSEVINYLNAATGVIVDGSPALKVGDTIITEAQLAALLTMITQEVNDDQ